MSFLVAIERTSSFAFKNVNEDVRSIGRKLNVRHVLEGSVRHCGDRLRMTAQLIDVAHGYHLRSDQFDRKLEDVFEIQEEIARAIAATMQIRLAYLRTPGLSSAAIEHDPLYANAYAGLADSLVLRGIAEYGIAPPSVLNDVAVSLRNRNTDGDSMVIRRILAEFVAQ